MKKKIIIVLIILAVITFGFYIFQGSRFQKTSIFENRTAKTNGDLENGSENDTENDEEKSVYYDAPRIEIKPADCDNSCSGFKKDNEKEYCQEICGMESFFEDAAEEGGSSDDCDEEKGIQKDYCLKDIAVGNKDGKTCDEISDANIKKSCNNRIMEDLLEAQSRTESQDY